MKKISLKNVANGLSRDELRTIKGGSGSCGSCFSDAHCVYMGCWFGLRACTNGRCDQSGHVGR